MAAASASLTGRINMIATKQKQCRSRIPPALDTPAHSTATYVHSLSGAATFLWHRGAELDEVPGIYPEDARPDVRNIKDDIAERHGWGLHGHQPWGDCLSRQHKPLRTIL